MKCLEAILLYEEVHLHPGHGMIDVLEDIFEDTFEDTFFFKAFASFDILAFRIIPF